MNERQISLLAAFAAARVDYVVVGGVAFIAHGYLRTTRDLDILDVCETLRMPKSLP